MDYLYTEYHRAKRNYSTLFILLALNCFCVVGQGQSDMEKILGMNENAGNNYEISICGNYAITGTSKGDENRSVYIYEKDSFNNWERVQQLTTTDEQLSDHFGFSVDVSNNYAVVGAPGLLKDPQSDQKEKLSGAVYVFHRNNAGNWDEVQKLTVPDKETNADFGSIASISGKYIVVDVSNEYDDVSLSNSSEAIYVFKLDTLDTWGQIHKVVTSSGSLCELCK